MVSVITAKFVKLKTFLRRGKEGGRRKSNWTVREMRNISNNKENYGQEKVQFLIFFHKI